MSLESGLKYGFYESPQDGTMDSFIFKAAFANGKPCDGGRWDYNDAKCFHPRYVLPIKLPMLSNTTILLEWGDLVKLMTIFGVGWNLTPFESDRFLALCNTWHNTTNWHKKLVHIHWNPDIMKVVAGLMTGFMKTLNKLLHSIVKPAFVAAFKSNKIDNEIWRWAAFEKHKLNQSSGKSHDVYSLRVLEVDEDDLRSLCETWKENPFIR